MHNVVWQGERAPESVATALRAAGLTCGASHAPDSDMPVVVCTASARMRVAPGAGARRAPASDVPVGVCTASARIPVAPGSCAGWIWLSRTSLSSSHRRDAVLRGAYDAMSLQDADVASRLAARLAELRVPLPAPPT